MPRKSVHSSTAYDPAKPKRLAQAIRLHLMLATTACLAVGAAQQVQAFDPVISLATLDGSTGFRLDGISVNNESGVSVSGVGDINGDGLDDLIIGAANAAPVTVTEGSSYVVFGRTAPFASLISLSNLNGSNGLRLDGVSSGNFSGSSVSGAGDVNGDGIDDLIIGAPFADPVSSLVPVHKRAVLHTNSECSGIFYPLWLGFRVFFSQIDLDSHCNRQNLII